MHIPVQPVHLMQTTTLPYNVFYTWTLFVTLPFLSHLCLSFLSLYLPPSLSQIVSTLYSSLPLSPHLPHPLQFSWSSSVSSSQYWDGYCWHTLQEKFSVLPQPQTTHKHTQHTQMNTNSRINSNSGYIGLYHSSWKVAQKPCIDLTAEHSVQVWTKTQRVLFVGHMGLTTEMHVKERMSEKVVSCIQTTALLDMLKRKG